MPTEFEVVRRADAPQPRPAPEEPRLPALSPPPPASATGRPLALTLVAGWLILLAVLPFTVAFVYGPLAPFLAALLLAEEPGVFWLAARVSFSTGFAAACVLRANGPATTVAATALVLAAGVAAYVASLGASWGPALAVGAPSAAALGLLALPSSQAFLAKARAGRAPSRWTVVGWMALFTGTGLVLALLPFRSLATGEDGATLRLDGAIALVGGLVLAAGALLALRRAGALGGAFPGGYALASAVLIGLVLVFALVTSAQEMSTADVVDGEVAPETDPRMPVSILMTLAFGVCAIVLAARRPERTHLIRVGLVLPIGLGLAAFVLGWYILATAGDLQAAAQARTHRETPGASLLAGLLAIAAAAWLARRKRA